MEILAPTGRLRAVVNLGNAVLARPGHEGIAVNLLARLAAHLDVELEVATVPSAPLAVEALASGAADASVLAVDPLRPLDWSPPLLAIEGSYAVPLASPLRMIEDVDCPGIRVVVGRGSAYDLHLTRTLRAAEIVRASDSASVLPVLRQGSFEVGAGLRATLQKNAAPDLRLLPGAFMSIRQAIAVPRGRGAALAAVIEAVAPEAVVAEIIARDGGAAVALARPDTGN